MEGLVWLVFAHFVGDYALQSEWMANNKARYWVVMLSHCIIWTAMISVALQFLGLFALWKVIFLIIGHGVMDEWKAHQPKRPDTWWQIYPDQAWHLCQLLVVFFLR